MQALFLIGGLLFVALALEKGGRFGAALVMIIVGGMILQAQRGGILESV